MGFFDKFKKKSDADAPPDFSSPLGADPFSSDPLGASPERGDQYKDPLSQDYGSGFDHDVFTSTTPTNADRARSYAATLGNPAPGTPGGPAPTNATTYAGAITGHEAQLILERLDTIKAELDSIKQRMIHVERYMEAAEQKTGQRKYF